MVRVWFIRYIMLWVEWAARGGAGGERRKRWTVFVIRERNTKEITTVHLNIQLGLNDRPCYTRELIPLWLSTNSSMLPCQLLVFSTSSMSKSFSFFNLSISSLFGLDERSGKRSSAGLSRRNEESQNLVQVDPSSPLNGRSRCTTPEPSLYWQPFARDPAY